LWTGFGLGAPDENVCPAGWKKTYGVLLGGIFYTGTPKTVWRAFRGASGDALTFVVSSSNIGRNVHTKLLILYCLLGNHQQLMKSRKTILF
jgi:hypothetical protein